MPHYLIEIGKQTLTSFQHGGAGLGLKRDPVALFPGYIEAVQHLSEFLSAHRSTVAEPVEIHIVPVEDGTIPDKEWTMEEILRNAG
jgi:hypothetical protein